jgi:porin
MFVEGNYDVHVFRGVTVEPDVQYIIRPNAQSSLHDAAVLGLKAHVEF